MINEVYGIFAGRFQPFHLGHLKFVRYVLQNITEKLVIAVIVVGSGDDERPPSSPHISQMFYDRFFAAQNPFTFWERYRMIRDSIEYDIGSHRDIHVVPIPRLDLWWSLAKAVLPPKRFWVLAGHGTQIDFERQKAAFFEELGERVEFVDAPTVAVSGTELRKLMREGGKWKHLVPQPVTTILEDIDAVNRIK